MKTTVSSKGQIVLPAEFRRMDSVETGQEFDVERLDQGGYRLVRRAAPPNQGTVDWLLGEPTKPAPDPRVVAGLRANEPEIAVDPVILGKLRFGILILPKGRKRAALEHWFDHGTKRLHCLSWDADTGLRWAELPASLRTAGTSMLIKDSMIAASALVHGLAVVTRTRADFANAGVPLVDPFVA